MDNDAIQMAIETLSTRKANALMMLRNAIAFPDDSRVEKRAERLVKFADDAGLTAGDLQTMLKPSTAAPPPRRYLFSGEHFSGFHAAGGEQRCLRLDDLARRAAGRIDLSGYTFELAPGQSKGELAELLAIVDDFNHHTPGDSPAGMTVLNALGFPGGSKLERGSAAWIGARVPLWKLKLAAMQARVMRAGMPDEQRKDWALAACTLSRLGMADLMKPVLTGDVAQNLK